MRQWKITLLTNNLKPFHKYLEGFFIVMSNNSVYQSVINNKLKLNKLSPNNFVSSSYNFNNPDAMFIYDGNQYRLELKSGLGNEYCNGTLAYKDGDWVVDKADDNEMKELLKSIGVENFADKK